MTRSIDDMIHDSRRAEESKAMSYEQTKREVERRLKALQETTKCDRARCIGMLDAEYAGRQRDRKRALDELFAELPKGKP